MFANFQVIASYAQLQFKSMNISNFSTKLPISVKIGATTAYTHVMYLVVLPSLNLKY